jgi:hypothetical protein
MYSTIRVRASRLRGCRLIYVQRREQAIRFPVDKVADHHHVQTFQTDFSVASLLDMSDIAGVTHSMRWQSVLLARTTVSWALALPNSDAFQPEILCRSCAGRVLPPQVPNHIQQNQSCQTAHG